MRKGRTSEPEASAMRAISRKPQPPTGVIIRSDEALLVSGPKPRNAKEKMVGNMMASKK